MLLNENPERDPIVTLSYLLGVKNLSFDTA